MQMARRPHGHGRHPAAAVDLDLGPLPVGAEILRRASEIVDGGRKMGEDGSAQREDGAMDTVDVAYGNAYFAYESPRGGTMQGKAPVAYRRAADGWRASLLMQQEHLAPDAIWPALVAIVPDLAGGAPREVAPGCWRSLDSDTSDAVATELRAAGYPVHRWTAADVKAAASAWVTGTLDDDRTLTAGDISS